jgi:ribonuclease E
MARPRVHELARELGTTSKELLARLAEMGETVKSASAALEEDVVRRLRESAPAEIDTPAETSEASGTDAPAPVPVVSFVAPAEPRPTRRRRAAGAAAQPSATEPQPEPDPADTDLSVAEDAEDQTADPDDVREAAADEATGARRRRRRGRRGRGGAARADSAETDGDSPAEAEPDEASVAADTADGDADNDSDGEQQGEGGSSRRRRRRRRSGSGSGASDDAGSGGGDDGVKGVKGSTRLEAKRQRRRDGRESGRKRPPILTEAEFLARRESVERVMALRQRDERTQIAVLEDGVLVEHYVTRASATSYVGNVYLGRVQNVLPSMEAAFVDIGKGRNGVLYAGEVNWDAAGLEGKARAIENALNSGDTVLVQVTKDPIGHKGARLTSQISLPGRFLVYVPGGGMTGISRKLPDTERRRLKAILKKIVPDEAGVIIRTAAEGASEEELTRDVERLQAQWAEIERQRGTSKSAPKLVHGEPDLAVRVVRDVFNEDFNQLIVQGDQAWETVSDYVEKVASDLADRVSRHTADTDVFHDLRVDEQLAKALDRKVWLPSGGSLIIDRTEAMTVIDVNTGKFVGAGGNLEQTVTRNNLEAAEEIVRQLRLRDVGGIVVIDFIDMVLESNRELVLRRLTECLGRDRTRHQVAEVTSLGLVQMTRKRVGEGLLEAFSEPCPTCNGRGVLVHSEPVFKDGGSADADDERPRSKRKRGGAKKQAEAAEIEAPEIREQRLAAMAAIHRAAAPGEEDEELDAPQGESEPAADAPGGSVELERPEPEAAGPEPSGPDAASPDAAAAEGSTPDTSEPAAASRNGRGAAPRRRRRAASRPAGPPQPVGS